MKHMLFFTAVIVFIAIVVVSFPSESGEYDLSGRYVLEDVDEPVEGLVCCTFEKDDRTRTCAALEGNTCEVCEEVCTVE